MRNRRREPAARWTATVIGAVLAAAAVASPAGAAQEPGGGGLVTVAGDPLVYDFDPGMPGDSVTGWWEVRGRSATPVPYDGVLAVQGQVSPVLARALVVHYGEVDSDGALVTWHPAGTLADPVTYADALSRAPSIDVTRPTTIPVRVSLPDPGLVTGEPGETMLVEAAFTVAFLAGSAPVAGPGTDDGDDRAVAGPPGGGVLALTGFGPWAAALAAAALIGLGLLARRRRRG